MRFVLTFALLYVALEASAEDIMTFQTGGGDGGQRCHDPPKAGGAHLSTYSITDEPNSNGSDVWVLRENMARLQRRDGLADPIIFGDSGGGDNRRTQFTAAQNYTYFPNIVRTPDSCSDSSGYACDRCCNGECCERVVGVKGDALYNNSEAVTNKTNGFADISSTARLLVPIRLILIVPSGSRQTLTVMSIDNQIALVNKYFAASRMRFFAYSFERVVSDAMASSCKTDLCYSDPNCAFFRDTVPQFVKDNTSAFDVMNVFLCTQIDYYGEAQFPWSHVEASPIHYVQVQYNAWNAMLPASLYGLGMTLVHEIGHYFGALHTFERDGYCDIDGDYVNDTVPCRSQASIYESCSTLRNSCGQGYDELTNIMNYAADRCMTHFSYGQFLRMEQATIRYRQEFVRRHLVEAECPDGGTNNNLEACRCADGGNPATLCGIYSERLPITLFLPGSARYNGHLYNSPDPTPPPRQNDPLISVGVIFVVVLAALLSFGALVMFLVLVYCCCSFPPGPEEYKKARTPIIPPQKGLGTQGQRNILKPSIPAAPKVTLAAAGATTTGSVLAKPSSNQASQQPAKLTAQSNKNKPSSKQQQTLGRGETFSLHMSHDEGGDAEVASQSPAAAFEVPEYSEVEFTDHTPRSDQPEAQPPEDPEADEEEDATVEHVEPEEVEEVEFEEEDNNMDVEGLVGEEEQEEEEDEEVKEGNEGYEEEEEAREESHDEHKSLGVEEDEDDVDLR